MFHGCTGTAISSYSRQSLSRLAILSQRRWRVESLCLHPIFQFAAKFAEKRRSTSIHSMKSHSQRPLFISGTTSLFGKGLARLVGDEQNPSLIGATMSIV